MPALPTSSLFLWAALPALLSWAVQVGRTGRTGGHGVVNPSVVPAPHHFGRV